MANGFEVGWLPRGPPSQVIFGLGGACQTFALFEENWPNALEGYAVKRGQCDSHDVLVMFLTDTI